MSTNRILSLPGVRLPRWSRNAWRSDGKVRRLLAHSSMQHLSLRSVQLLAATGDEVTILAGQRILCGRQVPIHVYLIMTGQVACDCGCSTGLRLIDRDCRPTGVRAVTDVATLAIPRQHLAMVLRLLPDAASGFVST
ncbi:MAG: hypothetical protein JWM48_2296 [Mycobacterium sp.]|jgi:hypothetical protein|nr:hypothetical protein [Mycobacterium sp.]